MKKILLSIVSVFAINLSFAQLDVAVTDITDPSGSTITIGDSIDITFTFAVMADTLNNGDTLSFAITLPGQTPIPVGLIMSQQMLAGQAASIQMQDKLPTSAVSAGSGDICVEFVALGMTLGDADASNNEFCKTYTWQNATTGIDENVVEDNIKFYNNSLVYHDVNGVLNIYNLAGQVVLSTNINNNSGSIALDDLTTGTYLVNFNDGNTSVTKKIIKF